MNKIVDIDSHQLVQLTNKLERMHRSALPVSVRGALNDVAFDIKKNTLPSQFDNNFTIRKKTFLSSHSTVIKSQNTFDIDQMESQVGIKKGKSKSGDQLEFQERGGVIKDKGFIPTENVRISNQSSKLIQKKLYYSKFKNSKKGVVDKNARRTIIRTDRSLLQVSKKGVWKILYRLRNNIKIKANPFLMPAAELSFNKFAMFFKKQAERRIK